MQYVAGFVTQYNLSLSSFVPNFRILTQVVAENSLTEKKCPYVFYRSDRRKIENLTKRRQNEDKNFNLQLHNTLLPTERYTESFKTLAQRGAEKSVTEIFNRERKMNK